MPPYWIRCFTEDDSFDEYFLRKLGANAMHTRVHMQIDNFTLPKIGFHAF